MAHARWADLNAGDCGLIAEGRSTPPPPAVGSGKLGTPCERIQLASSTACAELLALLGLGEDPHATIATAHVIAASEIRGLWQSPIGVLLIRT